MVAAWPEAEASTLVGRWDAVRRRCLSGFLLQSKEWRESFLGLQGNVGYGEACVSSLVEAGEESFQANLRRAVMEKEHLLAFLRQSSDWLEWKGCFYLSEDEATRAAAEKSWAADMALAEEWVAHHRLPDPEGLGPDDFDIGKWNMLVDDSKANPGRRGVVGLAYDVAIDTEEFVMNGTLGRAALSRAVTSNNRGLTEGQYEEALALLPEVWPYGQQVLDLYRVGR